MLHQRKAHGPPRKGKASERLTRRRRHNERGQVVVNPIVPRPDPPVNTLETVLEAYWAASTRGDEQRAQELAADYRFLYSQIHQEPPRATRPPRLPDKATWAAYQEERRQAELDRRLAELEAQHDRNAARLRALEVTHV